MLKALAMTLKIVILTTIQNMTALQIAAQLTLIPVTLLCSTEQLCSEFKH